MSLFSEALGRVAKVDPGPPYRYTDPKEKQAWRDEGIVAVVNRTLDKPIVAKVTIRNCSECRHRGHSGAFTQGGAKPVCDHDGAVDTFGAGKMDRYHWRHRVVNLNTDPPAKCPLRNGGSY